VKLLPAKGRHPGVAGSNALSLKKETALRKRKRSAWKSRRAHLQRWIMV